VSTAHAAHVPDAAVAGRRLDGAALWRLVRRLPTLALIGLIRVYQLVISPMTPPSCKYYPSCSRYAVVALERHGLLRGGWLAARRLARCHPWARGGIDDVPPARPSTSTRAGAGADTPVPHGPHLAPGPGRARSSTR